MRSFGITYQDDAPHDLSMLFEIPGCSYLICPSFRRVWSIKSRKWIGSKERGYVRVTLYKNTTRWETYLHRLVALVFFGEAPNRLCEVLHIPGCPKDEDGYLSNHPEWIRYGTTFENMQDRNIDGTMPRGPEHGRKTQEGMAARRSR